MRNQARAEPVVERIGQRDSVAGVVDNRQVRGVGAFVLGTRNAQAC